MVFLAGGGSILLCWRDAGNSDKFTISSGGDEIAVLCGKKGGGGKGYVWELSNEAGLFSVSESKISPREAAGAEEAGRLEKFFMTRRGDPANSFYFLDDVHFSDEVGAGKAVVVEPLAKRERRRDSRTNEPKERNGLDPIRPSELEILKRKIPFPEQGGAVGFNELYSLGTRLNVFTVVADGERGGSIAACAISRALLDKFSGGGLKNDRNGLLVFSAALLSLTHGKVDR
jgi:hypothetical protein